MKLSPLMEINYFMVINNREGEVKTEPGEDLKGTAHILYLTSHLYFDETANKLLLQCRLM